MIELRRHAFPSLIATALLLAVPAGANAEDEAAAAAAQPAPAPNAAAARPAPASNAGAAKPKPAPFSREAAELRRSHGKTGRTFPRPGHEADEAPAKAGGGATAAPAKGAAPATGAAAAVRAEPAPKPEIQNLGEGDQKLSLVQHDGSWSMHAENVNTDNIVRLWHQAGGPEVTVKMPVDRPFTMSVHKLSAERIVERLYVGYSYTLHYDDHARLVAVRIYSPRETAAYKAPRLTETLGKWKEVESDPGSIPAGGTGDEPEPEAGTPAGEPAAALHVEPAAAPQGEPAATPPQGEPAAALHAEPPAQ